MRKVLIAALLIAALGGCGDDAPANSTEATGGPATSATAVTGYVPGQTVDAEDYAGPAQQVAGHDHENAETVTTPAKRVCVRYRTYNGKRRCADYKTTPAKTVVTDDEDWYVVLADGTRVDVDAETQARYPVGSTYP